MNTKGHVPWGRVTSIRRCVVMSMFGDFIKRSHRIFPIFRVSTVGQAVLASHTYVAKKGVCHACNTNTHQSEMPIVPLWYLPAQFGYQTATQIQLTTMQVPDPGTKQVAVLSRG